MLLLIFHEHRFPNVGSSCRFQSADNTSEHLPSNKINLQAISHLHGHCVYHLVARSVSELADGCEVRPAIDPRAVSTMSTPASIALAYI